MSNGLHICKNVIKDTLLHELNPFFINLPNAEGLDRWVAEHTLMSSEAIATRSGHIFALMKHPQLHKKLREQRKAAAKVKDILMQNLQMKSKLVYVALHIKMLRVYVDSVAELVEMDTKYSKTAGHNGHTTEPSNIADSNEEMASFLLPMKLAAISPRFQEIKNMLSQAEARYTPIKNITLGVNINKNASAVTLNLLDINGQYEANSIIGIGTGSAQPRMMDSSAPSLHDESRSIHADVLFNPLPIREGREAGHIETLVHRKIEHAWKKPLATVMSILKGFPYEEIHQWILWIDSLEPILAGCTFALALKEKGLPLCKPVCHEDGVVAKKLYSPHMALVRKEMPIPLDAEVGQETLCLVTGANHSGKTTFIRTIAQCLLFAQLGFPVPAKEFCFTPVKHFYTLFSAGEQNDVSRYEREMQEINSILNAADEDSVIFMNEPLTSTSPIEAIPLLADILLMISSKKATQFVVTHMYDIYNHLCGKSHGNNSPHSQPASSHSSQDPPSHIQSKCSLVSYVAGSFLDKSGVKYPYSIEKRPPDAKSFVREIAQNFGVSAGQLLQDEDIAKLVESIVESHTDAAHDDVAHESG